MPNISIEEKDIILNHVNVNLSENFEFVFDFKRVATDLCLNEHIVRSVYCDMDERKLFNKLPLHDNAIVVFPNVKFFDFIRFGGYTGEEFILKSKLEVLIRELENLQKEDKANKGIERALSIASNLATILSLRINSTSQWNS